MLSRRLENGRLAWPSEGRRLLRERLLTISEASLAREIGVNRSQVSRWASGETEPLTSRVLCALRDKFRIPIESWHKPEVLRPCNETSVSLESTRTSAA